MAQQIEISPRLYGERLTRVGAALAERLASTERPLVTPYDLFLEIRRVYASGAKLYLRSKTPDTSDFDRIRRNLSRCNIINPDSDYHFRAHRILSNSDLPADDICCLVDPICYISHLSAMQRYGLTNRRPKALHLCRPDRKTVKELVQKLMLENYENKLPASSDDYISLTIVAHPSIVRGRRISVFETKHYGKSVQIRGAHARIATIEQTFLETLQKPKLCGGMPHVLNVWKKYAEKYLEEIISTVDECDTKIVKVRAGYILDELIGNNHPDIDKWLAAAQRGSSRLLDPEKPFASKYSEKWMISLNA